MWLGVDWLNLLLRMGIGLATAVVITVVWTFVARWLAPWNKPLRADQTSATIRPWPPLWWSMTILLGLVVIGGLFSGFASGSLGVAITMLVISGGLSVLVWCSLMMALPRAEITWNDKSVEGPSSALSMSRREIAWSDIARVKRSQNGNYFENGQGQRIVWSDMYIASGYLWGFLLHKRPDLKGQIMVLSVPNG